MSSSRTSTPSKSARKAASAPAVATGRTAPLASTASGESCALSVRQASAYSSSRPGWGMAILKRKRSRWASGSG